MKLAKLNDPKFQDALIRLEKLALPIKAAYRLKSIMSKVREECNKYEDMRRNSLNQHGRKKDGQLEMSESGNVQFDGDNMMLFINDIKQLNDLDAEIPTISLSELGSVSVSAEDLYILDGFIVE